MGRVSGGDSSNVSWRRGKLAPTKRAHPPLANAMDATHWSLVEDGGASGSSAISAYKASFSDPSSRLSVEEREDDARLAATLLLQRESAAEASPFENEGSGETRKLLSSDYRENYGISKSVLAPNYDRVRPAPGFDRLTANKTNFSMADCGKDGSFHTTQELLMPHPKEREPVEQATLGTECLGISFHHDIVTGTKTSEQTKRGMQRQMGPRQTLNTLRRKANPQIGGTLVNPKIDIITGRTLIY